MDSIDNYFIFPPSPLCEFDEECDFGNIDDADLRVATQRSLESGCLTPLIKQELKCRIQSRRLSEGKDEMEVRFENQPKSHALTTGEKLRIERRREQNRRAARKFRMKKRKSVDSLVDETRRLQIRQTALQETVEHLEKEKRELVELLLYHPCKLGCVHLLQNAV